MRFSSRLCLLHTPLPIHLLLFSVNLPIETLNIPRSKFHIHFPFPGSFQTIRPIPRLYVTFRNFFLTVRSCLSLVQPPNWRGHPLLNVRDCLFSIFTATPLIWWRSPPSATRGQGDRDAGSNMVSTAYISPVLQHYVNVATLWAVRNLEAQISSES